MKANDIPNDDQWKAEAVYTAYASKELAANLPDGKEKTAELKLFDDYIAAVKANDWKAYAKISMAQISADTTTDQETKDIALWSWQYRLDNNVEPNRDYTGDNWKNVSLIQLEEYKNTLHSQLNSPVNQQDKTLIEDTTNAILIQTYKLEHNISTYTQPETNLEGAYVGSDSFNYWTAFGDSTGLIMIIGVLMVIIAGSAISSEFSAGTIKFLLINPVKRWKIFMAKYISVLSVAAVMLIIYYIFNALLAGVFFGFGDVGAPYLHVVDGVVHMGSSFLFVAWKYLLGSLILLTMTTFAFAISSLVRNSALSIGLGVFLMLSGAGATQILGAQFGFSWARYILFANTNLNSVIQGTTPFWGLTVPFALIIVAIYMVVFLLTAWDGFMRRDIK
jgi:ABC-2 type transport system permease protein